jgi:hypothetical protein
MILLSIFTHMTRCYKIEYKKYDSNINEYRMKLIGRKEKVTVTYYEFINIESNKCVVTIKMGYDDMYEIDKCYPI